MTAAAGLLLLSLLGGGVNLVVDPSLEAGAVEWLYQKWPATNVVERTASYGARTGSYAVRQVMNDLDGWTYAAQILQTLKEGDTFLGEAWVKQLVPGCPYLLTLNAGMVLVRTDTEFLTYLEGAVPGTYTLLKAAPAPDPTGWTKLSLFERVGAQWAGDPLAPLLYTPGSTQLAAMGLPPPTAGCEWLVDDVGVAEMALTAVLEADLLSDLGDIATPGFDTDVQLVSANPEDEQHASLPAILLQPEEGGEADPNELGNRAALATQEWQLRLLVRGTSARTQVQNLLDDVRNAVGRSNGALQSRAGVDHATVVSWSAPLVSKDSGHQRAKMSATVRVQYTYARGGL